MPGAALEGISWDGSRVVLENLDDPGHLAAVTVGDPQAEPVIVRPKGRFAFDAISTDGNTLFLTQYARPNGEQVYQIRAVDLRTGTLLPDPVVDKADGGTTMTGDPFARATTRDFAYTLYVGGSEPFVHALATTGEIYSLCLDLPERANDLAAKSAWSVAVSRDGTTVVAANGILGSAYAFQEHGAVVSIPLAGRLESPPPLAVESSAVAYVKTEAGVERLDLAARSTQPYSTTAPVYGLLATDDGVLALGGDSVPLGLIEGH